MGIIILSIEMRNWGSKKLLAEKKENKLWNQDLTSRLACFTSRQKNNDTQSLSSLLGCNFYPVRHSSDSIDIQNRFSVLCKPLIEYGKFPKGHPANVTHIYLWDKKKKIFNKTYNWKSRDKIIYFRGTGPISPWNFNGRAFAGLKNQLVDSGC